jgi:hypothetical protein
MPPSKSPAHDLALSYFKDGGLDIEASWMRATSELEAAGKIRSDVDERLSYVWRPGVGRMVGSERNG